MRRGTFLLLAAGAVALSLAAGHVLRPALAPAPVLPVVEGMGGDLRLPSTLGREVALSDFPGRLVLLNFGFTTCPDVCPAVLGRMRALVSELGADRSRVQPVFVTIDPERDGLERMAEYLPYYDPSFIGLRGTAEQTAEAARRYRVYYEREESDSAAGYGFAHSSFIYLLDGQARVRATFGGEMPVAEMAQVVRRLLSEESS